MRFLALAALLAAPALAQAAEEPVAPYTVSDANAGATPMSSDAAFRAFGRRAGLERIVADFVERIHADPRIADIFRASDQVRLRRTLVEQFCYILGGGCAYTGRDMKTAHKDLGLQIADLNILVDNLQGAMTRADVPNWAQNRLLAKLAPMKRDVVER